MTSASDPAGGPRLLHVYSGNLYGGVERLLETLHAGGPAAGLRQDFALCFEGRVGERLREAGAPLIDPRPRPPPRRATRPRGWGSRRRPAGRCRFSDGRAADGRRGLNRGSPRPMPDRPTATAAPNPPGFWTGWRHPGVWLPLGLTFLPAVLLLPGTQPVRLPVRMSSYALGAAPLALFGMSLRGRGAHPSAVWLAAAAGVLTMMIAHPQTNGLLVALAQTGQYAAVAAPVVWMPRVRTTAADLRRGLFVFLCCVGVNSAVGVLQVYRPDLFMPAEFSEVVMNSQHGLGNVSYTGPDGRRIVRPPGLFDSPGAVAGAGMVAGIFGLAAVVDARGLWHKAAGGLFALCGLASILLAQVRSFLAVLAGMTAVYLGLLLARGQIGKVVRAGAVGAAAAAAAVAVAFALGGESVSNRVATLVEDDPVEVFYRSGRGGFIEQALTDWVFKYPLGAGLGRWGMMRRYFGNPYNRASPEIWAETNVNSWLLDGGVPLLVLYLIGLAAALRHAVRLAVKHPDRTIRQAAALICAVLAGWTTLIFSYAPFCSTLGIEFWFLAGLLRAAEMTAWNETPPSPARPGSAPW